MPSLTLEEAMSKISNIESYIESALADEVAVKARELIAVEVFENVYDYTPQPVYQASRRYLGGGIADPDNIDADVYGLTLQLTDTAQLQNLWSNNWQADVATIVQAGSKQFYQPYPRPFLEEAIRKGVTGGELEDALKRGIERSGLTVD